MLCVQLESLNTLNRISLMSLFFRRYTIFDALHPRHKHTASSVDASFRPYSKVYSLSNLGNEYIVWNILMWGILHRYRLRWHKVRKKPLHAWIVPLSLIQNKFSSKVWQELFLLKSESRGIKDRVEGKGLLRKRNAFANGLYCTISHNLQRVWCFKFNWSETNGHFLRKLCK